MTTNTPCSGWTIQLVRVNTPNLPPAKCTANVPFFLVEQYLFTLMMQQKIVRNFRYEPLDLTTASIRLVQLLPGETDDPINISLIHQRLGGDHACLSYEWGPESPARSIFVNGLRLPVRDNLWQFLRFARSCKFDKRLWIDAICINQCDTDEKSHQISIMGKIYTHAAYVIVHFPGLSSAHLTALNTTIRLLDEPDSVPESPLLRRFAQAWHSREPEYRAWNDVETQIARSFFSVLRCEAPPCWGVVRNPNPLLLARQSQACNDYRWMLFDAFRILTAANYWGRVWVIQRVHTCNEGSAVVLHCAPRPGPDINDHIGM